jgi:hypothetical protein
LQGGKNKSGVSDLPLLLGKRKRVQCLVSVGARASSEKWDREI